MFFFFKQKYIDKMKINKFYYYSPVKLKLVPIENFFSKATSIIFLLIVGSSFFSVILTKLIDDNPNVELLAKQNQIIEKQFGKEINQLETKYILLKEKLNDLQLQSNDIRLAVNLEPVELGTKIFGIGGSDFSKLIKVGSFNQNSKLSDLYNSVCDLEVGLKIEKSNYSEILDKYKENIDLFDKIPAIRPVKSSIGDRFGMRFHPILKRRRMHHGLDFLSNVGEDVFSPGDGIITYIGNKGGYGKVIRINHGYGYETLFAHLSKYKVKKGQKVKRGEIIALSGNSGSLSTGPHLHYEVRHNGISLNPRNFIFDNTKLFDTSNEYLANR